MLYYFFIVILFVGPHRYEKRRPSNVDNDRIIKLANEIQHNEPELRMSTDSETSEDTRHVEAVVITVIVSTS